MRIRETRYGNRIGLKCQMGVVLSSFDVGGAIYDILSQDGSGRVVNRLKYYMLELLEDQPVSSPRIEFSFRDRSITIAFEFEIYPDEGQIAIRNLSKLEKTLEKELYNAFMAWLCTYEYQIALSNYMREGGE